MGGFTKNRYIRGEWLKTVRFGEFADLGGAQQKNRSLKTVQKSSHLSKFKQKLTTKCK